MPITDRERLRCVANDSLRLILMPTEACNFRCTYCYEDFRYKRMDDAVVRGINRFLDKKAQDLSLLEISWFGGEPLLATDVVVDVSEHVQSLAEQYPQIHYYGDMTTNAYLLTPERFERLLALGIRRYQITFDGPAETHDRKRVRAGGGGTFARIWSHLLGFRATSADFKVNVRLHVDRENIRAMPRFMMQYASEFGADERFRLFIRPLGCFGGGNDATLPAFDSLAGREAMARLKRFAERLRIRTSTLAEEEPSICYAVRANSYVVRANGRLNKCTVALEHPNNQLGHISEDGHIYVDHPKLNGWMRGLWSDNLGELECPMRGFADARTQPQRDSTTIRLRSG